MPSTIRVGLIGDFNPGVTAHQAIPPALALAAAAAEVAVTHHWIPTESIVSPAVVASFDALWCVPASPYRSMDGALTAIRFARERQRPFLGTCGGFQHAVIEYARNVMGWANAEHGETAPDATRAVIAPLACALVEVSDAVSFTSGSRLARAYGASVAREGYHCNYGLNPAFVAELTRGPLRVTSYDGTGEVRGIELDGHPFFVATLFQPERAALPSPGSSRGRVPPVVQAFVEAIRGSATRCR